MLSQKTILIIAVSFAAIHIAVTYSAHALFQESVPSQTTWEYTTRKTHSQALDFELLRALDSEGRDKHLELRINQQFKFKKFLNEMGQDGWEIYSVNESGDDLFFYFKRPL